MGSHRQRIRLRGPKAFGVRSVPFLAVLAAAAFVPFTLHALPSADLWWLLADGRLIATTGSVPSVDPFSYTAHGRPWHNDQWLVAWLFYAVFQLGGLGLLQLGKAGLLCLTFALAVVQARSRASSSGWAALGAGLFCMAFSEHASFFDVRAYLFSYLNLVLLWTALQRGVRPWFYPPLFLLWVNEHGAVTGGLVLLFLWALASRSRPLGLAWLGSLAACLVNPGGYNILLHGFRLTGSDWGKYLNEWQPIVGNSRFWPFFVFLGLTTLLALRLPWPERLVLLAFGALSLTGWRHVPLYCWLAITPWTLALRRLPELRGRWYALLAGGTCAVALGLLLRTPLAGLSLENELFPRWACDFLKANRLEGRLLHPYGFGGYLLWRLGGGVGIDGRAAQVYPVETYVEYLKAAQFPERFAEWTRKYDVQALLLFRDPAMREATSALVGGNEASLAAGWTSVYRDDLCEIYLPAGVMAPQGGLIYPPSPASLVEQARELMGSGQDPQAVLAQALALDPNYAPALFLYGTSLFQKGSAQGVGYLEQAAKAAPYMAGVHLNLAVWFAGKDPGRSRLEAEAELRLDPSSKKAAELLRH